MAKNIGAVITGGDFQALGATRALTKKKIPVIVLDGDHCICQFSKYATKVLKAPNPSNHEAYINYLIDLAMRQDVKEWVVFPNSDETVCLLSKNKTILEKYYKITTPPWEIIRKVYIKKNTYKLAKKAGIPIPETHYPKNLDQLRAMNLSFPVVIKPSIRDNFYNKVKIKAFKITNGYELEKIYRWVNSIIDPSEVLVQEFIPGGANQLYAYCTYFKNGESVCGITAKRSRQHPMDFGHASTFAEIVDEPELQKIATKFLRLIDYRGIAEVEFMKDPRNGDFKLIEVNPRFWGYHSLAIAAGANLPYLAYMDMIHNKIEPPRTIQKAKWVRLVTDMPTVFNEIIRGNITIGQYLKSLKGHKEFAVFSLDDPLPFFAELVMIPYLWAKRGF